jgi:hypothetical protein
MQCAQKMRTQWKQVASVKFCSFLLAFLYSLPHIFRYLSSFFPNYFCCLFFSFLCAFVYSFFTSVFPSYNVYRFFFSVLFNRTTCILSLLFTSVFLLLPSCLLSLLLFTPPPFCLASFLRGTNDQPCSRSVQVRPSRIWTARFRLWLPVHITVKEQLFLSQEKRNVWQKEILARYTNTLVFKTNSYRHQTRSCSRKSTASYLRDHSQHLVIQWFWKAATKQVKPSTYQCNAFLQARLKWALDCFIIIILTYHHPLYISFVANSRCDSVCFVVAMTVLLTKYFHF